MLFDDIVARFNVRSPILIQTPWTGTVGNCAEEVYFGLLKARRDGKRVCFLFPKDTVGWFRFARKKLNSELPYVHSSFRFLGERNLLVVMLEWLVSLVYYQFKIASRLLTFCSRFVGRRLAFRADYMIPELGQAHLWWPEGVAEFDRSLVEQMDWRRQFATPLSITLPESHAYRAEKVRAQMGLPLNAWYVCLHVREGSLYNDHAEAYFRNARIENYFKAIKEITDRGGWVVRLGDPTMTKLPMMERVIDYAHSSMKSDLLDVYLIRECSLYIGSQSGIWDVAALFQKPLLMPNMCEWSFCYPQRGGDLGILKHVWSKSRQRFLSVQELLANSSRCQYLIATIDDDFVFHENSEMEIVNLVREYYDQQPQARWSSLQTDFHMRRIEETYRILETERIWKRRTEELLNKYRIASRLEGCTGAISDGFLRANWEANSHSAQSA